MTAARIADRVRFGYAKAGSVLGTPHNLYRPISALAPALSTATLLRAIPFVASATPKGDFAAPAKYGTPIRYALTDTRIATDPAYSGDDALFYDGISESTLTPATPVRPGDYIDGASGTYFFGSTNVFEIPMIVMCNAVVTIKRPAGQDDATDLSPGLHGFEGRTVANDRVVLLSWPASVLAGGRTEASRPDLPGDVAARGMQILLPATPGWDILTMDRIEDGRQIYTVSSVELTTLGWRIAASFSEGM